MVFFNITQPILLPMIRTRWGRVINLSSVAGIMGNRGQTNYAAAKAGLHGATKSLALELASRGITVNTIAPGIIAGRATEPVFNDAIIKKLVPMKRAGRPEEVAALVAFSDLRGGRLYFRSGNIDKRWHGVMDNRHKHIACVIPAYNEVHTIAKVVAGVRRYVAWVIVVDDGSVDGTADKLVGLPVTLLNNPITSGKASSIVRGARAALQAGAEAIITIDADGQHCPEDIPRLIAMAERHPGTIVIAARVRGRSTAPALRRFANRLADFWISWAAGYRIADSQSGFRLYPAQVFNQTQKFYGLRAGFVFESEILIDAAHRGHRSVSVPVDSIYRPDGRASHYRPIVDTFAHYTDGHREADKNPRNAIGPPGSMNLLRDWGHSRSTRHDAKNRA